MISESGGDIEDVFRDIKKDEELAEDVGLEKPSEGKLLVGPNQSNA